MGLLNELRRRRVLPTLALYVVGAWGLVQVSDVLFGALGLPDAAVRYLLVAAIICFPIAIVFTWFFDITPKGLKRTGPAGADGDAVAPLRALDYLLLAALVVVAALIFREAFEGRFDAPFEAIAESTGLAEDSPPPLPTEADGPPMVGVLPFAYRGQSEDAEFFAAGVHDDLLTQLARIAGLRVISRTSVMQYADTTKAISIIGRELQADAILEGGVQLAGSQIRINAQLIDTRTDAHL